MQQKLIPFLLHISKNLVKRSIYEGNSTHEYNQNIGTNIIERQLSSTFKN